MLCRQIRSMNLQPVNEATTVTNGNETTISEQKTVKVLVDKLNIRSAPSTKAPKKGMTNIGDTYTVYNTTTREGYTWYRIGEDKWIADKNGEWVRIN